MGTVLWYRDTRLLDCWVAALSPPSQSAGTCSQLQLLELLILYIASQLAMPRYEHMKTPRQPPGWHIHITILRRLEHLRLRDA